MPGKARLITVIPTCDSERTLPRTLASLVAQTCPPDRVLVVDYGSKDGTAQVVAAFTGLPCEWRSLPPGHRFFDACNTGLQLAAHTRHLHLIRAGDVLQPAFYATLLQALGDGDAFALVYCLEEIRDDTGHRVSVSGWRRSQPTRISRDAFLRVRSLLQPLTLSTVLLRTGGHRVPVKFRVEISQLAHKGFFASFAAQCERIVRVNQPLCARQWDAPASHELLLPGMQPLVYDELRVMQTADHLRERRAGWWLKQRMLWVVGRRAALKARRAAQMHKPYHSREIARAGRSVVRWYRWLPARAAVAARDWVVFGALRRPRDPRDLYR